MVTTLLEISNHLAHMSYHSTYTEQISEGLSATPTCTLDPHLNGQPNQYLDQNHGKSGVILSKDYIATQIAPSSWNQWEYGNKTHMQ